MEILNSILIVALRSVIAVIVLFIISRLTGPRQISQLTFYDYIVGISIGSIAAMAVEKSISIIDMAVSMIVFGGFAIAFAYSTSKSMFLRKAFSGKPSIMIYNGKIIESALKKNNFDINDLVLNCRNKGYFNLEEIAFAILESNGQLSIMPKSQNAPLTPKDMAIPTEQSALEYNLIIDGVILEKNLKSYGKDEQWINAQLKSQGVKSARQVLLATGDNNNNLRIYLKSEVLPHDHFFM